MQRSGANLEFGPFEEPINLEFCRLQNNLPLCVCPARIRVYPEGEDGIYCPDYSSPLFESVQYRESCIVAASPVERSVFTFSECCWIASRVLVRHGLGLDRPLQGFFYVGCDQQICRIRLGILHGFPWKLLWTISIDCEILKIKYLTSWDFF